MGPGFEPQRDHIKPHKRGAFLFKTLFKGAFSQITIQF